VKLSSHLLLLPRLRTGGTTPPKLHIFSRYGTEKHMTDFTYVAEPLDINFTGQEEDVGPTHEFPNGFFGFYKEYITSKYHFNQMLLKYISRSGAELHVLL
jgi:hypothetical protein